MKKTLSLDFGEVTFYDNYMIAVINEGVDLKSRQHDILVKNAKKYFQDKPFVYITHRVNSYAVDPSIYFETIKIKTLVGFAVVSKKYQAKVNAQIEQMFYNKTFEIFDELEDAIQWAKKLTKSK